MGSGNADNLQVFFNINEAANMVGVSPATLRNWEKAGLYRANRSENKYRIYTMSDIEILKKIRYYAIDMKMNTMSIKSLIMKSGALTTGGRDNDTVDFNDVKKLLSEKWKACRERKQITLEDVAKDIDISASYLSRIENGQANVSLEVLNKLANYYDESLLSFLVQEPTESRTVRKHNGEAVDIGLEGVGTESLVDQKKHLMFPMLFSAEPGCGSMNAHRHHGEEFIYILKGKMHITLNHNEEYELSAGDSFYFNSFEYHKWHNSGSTKLELIWVHTHCESN